MNRSELKQIIQDCCNDVLFTYNNKRSGITSEVKDYVPTFYAWHGSEMKDYSSVDDLMADKFFSNKSINDLTGTIEFMFA